MVKPLIGDVVVVPFPQSDLTIGKRRPALVVASPKGNDLILCQITSQQRTDGYSVSLLRTDFVQGQLSLDCFIRVNRLFTVEHRVINYTVGKISPQKIAQVLAGIRSLFT